MSIARIRTSFSESPVAVSTGDQDDLLAFFDRHTRIAVISGAGCSTASGIPAYRDEGGQWQQRKPIFHQEFLRSPVVRRRYWARSYYGWPRVGTARPNAAHRALADLEQSGAVSGVVTQNVDGLHQQAGSRKLTELHGGLARVICLACQQILPRAELQEQLSALNPGWSPELLRFNADGDAELDEQAYPGFRIVDCPHCQGVLKPDVVFFGGSVPADQVQKARDTVLSADAVLVVGSSLAVWSSLRLVRGAAANHLPVAAINDGRTRADALLQFKLPGQCELHLSKLAKRLLAG